MTSCPCGQSAWDFEGPMVVALSNKECKLEVCMVYCMPNAMSSDGDVYHIPQCLKSLATLTLWRWIWQPRPRWCALMCIRAPQQYILNDNLMKSRRHCPLCKYLTMVWNTYFCIITNKDLVFWRQRHVLLTSCHHPISLYKNKGRVAWFIVTHGQMVLFI